MRNEINFNYNWNNKLTGQGFTTLRLRDESRFHPGEVYSIMLKGAHLFDAEIIDVRHYFLHQINEYVARLDTGYSAAVCRDMIKRMYPKVDWEKRQLSLVLFSKLKSKPAAADKKEQPEEVST